MEKRYNALGWNRSFIHTFNWTFIDVALKAIVKIGNSQFWGNSVQSIR